MGTKKIQPTNPEVVAADVSGISGKSAERKTASAKVHGRKTGRKISTMKVHGRKTGRKTSSVRGHGG
jgi:hypothetical protein